MYNNIFYAGQYNDNEAFKNQDDSGIYDDLTDNGITQIPDGRSTQLFK